MITLEIKPNDSGQRFDRFLAKHLPKAAKNFLMRMIREKKIKLNNKKANPETILMEGDEVQIYFSDETYNKFRKSKIQRTKANINLVYEDNNIIVVDKPAGLISHVSKNLKETNLIDGVIHYMIENGEYNPRLESSFVPALCNRLDRNTSGLVLVGKNATSLKKLNDMIKNKEIRKIYYAIVVGQIKFKGKLTSYYSKNSDKNKVNLFKQGEKDMVSYITPYKVGKKFSLVEVELLTGRTHQIRAQLASLGNPIIGDNKYGNTNINLNLNIKNNNWQRLVAAKLMFPNDIEELPDLSNRVFKSKYLESLFSEYSKLEV